jgi:hypothetical protein
MFLKVKSMKKKILLAIIIGISFMGLTISIANSLPKNLEKYQEIKFLEGVAFDKTTNETKQVAFLLTGYENEKGIFLIIGKEIFTMTEFGNISNPEKGIQVFFYKSEDGSILTLLFQRFGRATSIAGEFKNYLITFRNRYRHCFELKENFGKQVVEINPGLGKFQKEVRSKIREETRPVKGNWKGF